MYPESVNEVGCIHTCQGLDLSYVGVIVGPDLMAISQKLHCFPENRARQDQSIKGYKRILQQDPINGRKRVDRIIKNTYKTLMTRGLKGCYVYATDPETQQYFKDAVQNQILFDSPVFN